MKPYLAVAGLFVWIIGAAIIFENSRNTVEQDFIDSLESKELDITQLLDISFAYNISIRKQIETQLNLPIHHKHPLRDKLQDFPQWNAYGLSGKEVVNNQPYSANLTGIGPLAEVSDSVVDEIDSILNVDLSAPFIEEKHSFIWAYYQSINGFILLAPSVETHEFQLRQEHYSKPYWQIATPENNPDKKTVISDLYEDGAGQGMMISISSPVYVNDTFQGITSIDVGLDYLTYVLHSGFQPTDKNASILTKDGNPVIGDSHKNSDFHPNFDQHGLYPSYKFFSFKDNQWLISNLIKDKFYVVYELENNEINWLAAKRSALAILALTLVIANFVLLSILYRAFSVTRTLSQYDRLSNLYNRMTHEEISNQLFSSEPKIDSPVSILMADIDNFKQLNDSKGHHVGDQGITRVSAIIKSISRKTDVVGRFGGEEFIVTMPDTNEEQALAVAERIRAAVENDRSIADTKITISIGIAESSSLNIFDYQELCKKADLALYQAKHEGRNRSVVFSSNFETKQTP
jgi:diguanylate cyclase (GGDEF)-like protein